MKLRAWPDSLFGRLVMILAVGMFAGQLLTSTIWFETHDNRTLEIPARLFASRLADTVRLLQHAPDATARDAVVTQLSDARYRLQWTDTPQPVQQTSLAKRTVGDLIAGVIRRRLGEPIDVRLIDAELRVTRQVQQRIEQHRTMSVRQHEAVAIGPLRIGGIELHVLREQGSRDLGHAERHALMAFAGAQNRIDGEEADRVGQGQRRRLRG